MVLGGVGVVGGVWTPKTGAKVSKPMSTPPLPEPYHRGDSALGCGVRSPPCLFCARLCPHEFLHPAVSHGLLPLLWHPAAPLALCPRVCFTPWDGLLALRGVPRFPPAGTASCCRPCASVRCSAPLGVARFLALYAPVRGAPPRGHGSDVAAGEMAFFWGFGWFHSSA